MESLDPEWENWDAIGTYREQTELRESRGERK
jgi:hypothetical protein